MSDAVLRIKVPATPATPITAMRLVLLLVALSLSLSASTVAAQLTMETRLPLTPPPEECTVERMPIEEVRARYDAALATPLPVPPASPLAGSHPFALPDGVPADVGTVSAIIATELEAVACVNAGDFLAQQTFLSDRFAIESLIGLRFVVETGGNQMVEDLIAAQASTPVPVAEDDRSTLVGLRDVRTLPDGRVGAVVEIAPGPGAGGTGVRWDWVVYVREGDRWLVDESIIGIRGEPISGLATPTSATPVP